MKNNIKSILFVTFSILVLIIFNNYQKINADGAKDSINYNSILDNYIKEKYNNIPTVTIVIRCPSDGMRTSIDFISRKFVGHSYLRLSHDNSNFHYIGFGTGDPLDSDFEKYVIKHEDSDGNIILDSEDTGNKPWTVATVYKTTNEQIDQIFEYAKKVQRENKAYNILSYNCTTFVAEALESAGIKPPFEKHYWNIDGSDKEQLSENIFIGPLAEKKLSQEEKEDIINKVIKELTSVESYSPVDAANDIKKSGRMYLMYEYNIGNKKEGSIVEYDKK